MKNTTDEQLNKRMEQGGKLHLFWSLSNEVRSSRMMDTKHIKILWHSHNDNKWYEKQQKVTIRKKKKTWHKGQKRSHSFSNATHAYKKMITDPSSQTLLQTELPVLEIGWVFCVRSEEGEPESVHSSFSTPIWGSSGSTGWRVCWIRRFLAIGCHDS